VTENFEEFQKREQSRIAKAPCVHGTFCQALKSKVGLAAAIAAALRINLNIDGCGVVATPVHAPSHAPLLLPLMILLSHNIPFPRVQRDHDGSGRLS
jgi:hypothetical protein